MLLISRGIWWHLLTYIWWWRGRTFWWVCKPMSLKNISAKLGVTSHWLKLFLCKQKSVSLAKPYKYCFHLQYVNCLNGWNFLKCDFLVSSFLKLWWSKKFQFMSAVYKTITFHDHETLNSNDITFSRWIWWIWRSTTKEKKRRRPGSSIKVSSNVNKL